MTTNTSLNLSACSMFYLLHKITNYLRLNVVQTQIQTDPSFAQICLLIVARYQHNMVRYLNHSASGIEGY